MLKILVTGGEGFIGSWVVENLSHMGHRVTSFDNGSTYDLMTRDDHDALCQWRQRNWKRVRRLQGDVTAPGTLFQLRGPYDVVVHLASYPRAKLVNDDPAHGVDNIVGGTMRVLEAVEQDVGRFVFVSSSMIYGHFGDGASEDTMPRPINIYGEAKLCAEKLVQQFCTIRNIDYVVARPSGVYGAGDMPDRVLSKFFEAAMANQDLTVHDANNRVDFTYVEDAADGIIKCAMVPNAVNKIFNITAGEATSLGEAAGRVIQLTGSRSKIKDIGQHKLYPERGTLDISRASKFLKYKPKYSFDQGIKKYYEWLQNKI